MSFAPSYAYVEAEEFAKTWKEQQRQAVTQKQGRIAVVYVRDDDVEGGNIKGCWNVPSTQFADRVDEVVERLGDAKQVVFHCSLSQARGPKAARIYSEARNAAIKSGKLPSESGHQIISVLRDGFANFGAVYKSDPLLVEKFDAESWKYR